MSDWMSIVGKMKTLDSKANKGGSNNFYQATRVNGVAKSVIRFLPSMDTETPVTMLKTHWFRDAKNNVIAENCLNTIGQSCPICRGNNKFWEEDSPFLNKKEGKARKANTYYYANILVVRDQNKPENNGKVMLYKFPKTVFDKLMSKLSPGEDSDFIKPVNIFDYKEGADFLLHVTEKKDGGTVYPNYELCMFLEQGPIRLNAPLTDAEIKDVESRRLPLKEYSDGGVFKSADELEQIVKRCDALLYGNMTEQRQQPQHGAVRPMAAAAPMPPSIDDVFEEPARQVSAPPNMPTSSADEDDDEFFNNLSPKN